MKRVIEGVIQAIKSAQKISLSPQGVFPSPEQSPFGSTRGKRTNKRLQPSFSTGRTQLTQFCQDTFSSWGRGQAFPSGFGCAKAGILCSSIPICPPLTVLCDNFLAHGADDEISPLFVSV